MQFLFGLGAYLDGLAKDESQIPDKKKTEFDNIQDTIKNFIMDFFKFHITSFDLKNFLNIYPLMYKKEVDNFWQWGSFNMPADGKWRWRKDNTETYFLKLVFDVDETEFKKLKIEQIDSQTLSHLEYLKLTIDQKLQTLKATDDNKNKIYTLLRNISVCQQQERTAYISKGILEQNKILEFIHKFEESFKKSSYMRALFKNKENIQKIKR